MGITYAISITCHVRENLKVYFNKKEKDGSRKEGVTKRRNTGKVKK